MSPVELASLLTALGAILGVLWSVFSTRQAGRENADTRMWNEAMQLLAQLEHENERLRERTRHEHLHEPSHGAHDDPPG